MKIVLAVLLFLGLAGCADSHSGFYCPSSFSSNWDQCTSNPYPDAQ